MVETNRCAGCEAELGPADRFCSACGTARPRYCAACGAELVAEARFCGRCGARVEAGNRGPGGLPGLDAPALAEPPVDTPEPEAPPALRQKFENVKAELQGDRREVVVVFADLSGFTSMSETMDPEAVTILMNRILKQLADAVYEYEGYVDKFIGDAVMALFGAPLAHEDDPERAVLAGLAMQSVVARHNESSEIPLALRVGLNVGEVVAAHLGLGGRMQYTVLGDTVNVASRLEGAARPGTVLVSETVQRRVAHRFEAVEVPPLSLKGKTEPVRAFEIGSVREISGTGIESEAAFVGRELELAEAAAFLEDVGRGRPGALLIEAEAGGGKTRLVEEALRRAGDGIDPVVLRFTSVRHPGQRVPASEVFRQLAGAEESDPRARALELLGPDAERHRAGVLGLADEDDAELGPADPATARQNRWVAVAALLRRAARRRPLLLWIEDAHWLDEAAAEFLGFLLPLLEHAPIGVIVTGRPELRGDWIPLDIRRLVLTPLADDASRALLGDLIADLEIDRQRDLVRRSEGNPLYLEQLVRALREGGAGAGVPGTVQGLIMARIDRLPAPVQTLLQMAAVLGTRFPAPLLRRMYGLEAERADFDAALRALERGGFLRAEDPERGRWGFRHALTQEVAYGGLLVRLRKVLHESAARLGEEYFADRVEAEAPFFAYHYWQAGLSADAAPHLWIAGREAAEAHELPAAEELLDRLAEAAREDAREILAGTERPRFLEIYGNVLLHRGRLEDADLQFQELEREGERAGRPEWSARGLEYRGRTAWYRGALDVAEELFERGLRVLPADEDRIQADLHNDLGIVYYYRGRPEDAFAQHQAALSLRERLGDRQGMAKSCMNIGNLLADFRDDLEAAEEQYRRGLELAEAVGDRQLQYGTLFNLGTIVQDRGQWGESIEIFRRGERLLDEVGWSHAQYQNLQKQAESEIALGRIDAALRHLQLCLSHGDAVLEPVNRINTRTFLFDAYLRVFADEIAEAAIVDARRLMEELSVEEALEGVLLREGRWRASQGRWREAAEAFAEAAAQARRHNHGSFEELAEAHRQRAVACAGEDETHESESETDATERASAPPHDSACGGRAPLRVVIGFLRADAESRRRPSPAAAESLGRAADEAARLGDAPLERAAAERMAAVWKACGDAAAHDVALDRAARAMADFEDGLSADLAEAFAAHPRNAALRKSAGAS
jgi:class 3 adenylate cyclase/tetratricopeptide (TPR) repeat protein